MKCKGTYLVLLVLLVLLANWLPSSWATVFRSTNKYSEPELKDYGRSITVRVFDHKTPEYGGSGVLI